jgi:hypothetical protein
MSRWIPYSVPILYFVVVSSLRPADRLGEPEFFPGLGRTVYDDYDVTAYAIRGLNAELGRTAGRLDDPCRQRRPPATLTAPGARNPLADSRYYLEYPHAALVLFRLPYRLPPAVGDLPPAAEVADACHNDVVEYLPRSRAEWELWRKFRHATDVYAAAGVACLLALMAVTRWGYRPDGSLAGPAWLFLLPACLYFSANRFDVLPAVGLALSLALLGRGWMAGSAVCLGVATMVKIYPGLVAVLVVRYLGGRPRDMARWTAVYALTLAAVGAVTVASTGWEATLAPYRVQLGRSLEGLTFYGAVLPRVLGGDTAVSKGARLGFVLVVLIALAWRRPTGLESLLRRSALALIAFLAVQVFYSPQWVLWLIPLLAPLAGWGLRSPVTWLVVGLDLVTYATFPVAFDMTNTARHQVLIGVLIYLRALVLGGLAVALVMAERRGATAASFARSSG